MKKVGIELNLENQQYLRKLRQSETALDKFARTKNKLKSLSMAFTGVGLAIGAVVAVVSGFTMAMKKCVQLSEKQVRAENRLNAVLKSTKNAAGLSAEEIKNMASSLQAITTYGDEAIIEGQNLLLTFTKIGKDVFPKATETMLDMSEMMGTDLKTSAVQLGKALNDPLKGISALSRVGVQLSKDQKKQIKQFMEVNDVASAQKIILQELSNQMGGQARAAADSLNGELAQLKNNFGDRGEEIGASFTPGLREMVDALGDSFKATGFLTRAFTTFGRSIGWALTHLANFVRMLDIYNNTSTIDRLREESEKLIKSINYYRAKGLDDDNRLIVQKRQKLKEINEQMQLLTDSSIELGKKINEAFVKVENSLDSLDKKQKKFLANSKMGEKSGDEYGKKTQSMVEYYERLGQYKQAEMEKEAESFQSFQQTQNYKRMSLEEQAIAEQQFQDQKLVASYRGAQQEAQIREQVLRAKMGMESQAFQGAQMFAEAGSQLMSSQNKQLFKLGQAASIANIGMNTAEAIMKGWAMLGPIGGGAFAALMGTVAGVQVANVLKQKPPEKIKNESADAPKPVISAPAFATGTTYLPQDTLAYVHKGESIIPKSFNEGLKDGDLSLGGGTTIIVEGNIIDTDGLLQIMQENNIDIQRRTGTNIYSRKSVY